MRIISKNYADELTLVPSNVDTEYPITNVQDQRLATKFHSTTTSIYITVNSSNVSTEPLAIALLGHNITEDATIEFQVSDVSDFATVTSEIMTWNEGIILKFIDYSGTSDVYNRFYINDPSNTDGYISMGRLWVGPYLNITPSSLLDFGVTFKNSDINVYGKDRQKFALPGVVWRKFDLSFPPTDTTMIDEILDLIDRVGYHSSFIFCNFDTIRNYEIVEPCYVSITGDVGFTHESRMKWKYQLSMEEDC